MKVLFLYNEVESLGLQYLSSALRHAGHETALLFDPRLFDFFRQEYNSKLLKRMFSFRADILKRAVEYQPDVIGFQILTANHDWCCEYAEELRRLIPGVTIVAGGYHATANSEAVLRTGHFDWIVRGEAEDGLVEFVDSLQVGEVDTSIANLAYLDEDRYVENPLRAYEQDLDRYHEPDKELFWQLGPPFTTGHLVEWRRGCPWGCTFCGNNYYRRIYYPERKDYMFTREFLRTRSVDHVLAELRRVKATYNPKLLRVNDDDICADEAWLLELADKMTDHERIPFKCFAIPNNINERTIVALKKIGCEQIQMGVQSLNADIRKLIGRPNSESQIANAIDLCREHGIGLFVDQIFGLPGETEEDCKTLERFYEEHPPNIVSVYWLDIWAGAEVLDQAVNAGTITQETADAIRSVAEAGDIATERRYHNKFAKPYAVRLEVRNHFKAGFARFANRSGLWWLLGKLGVFRVLRAYWAFRHAGNLDQFPEPRKGYDLSWARFPRFFTYYMKLRMRSWFSRENPISLSQLPALERAPRSAALPLVTPAAHTGAAPVSEVSTEAAEAARRTA